MPAEENAKPVAAAEEQKKIVSSSDDLRKNSQAQEEPRKYIPGVRECIMEIKALSDKISGVEDEVRACKEKIHALMEDNSTKAERVRITDELKALSEALKALKVERKAHFDDIDRTKAELDGLKETTEKIRDGSTYRTVDDVRRRMQALETRLVTGRITPADERSIASEMQSLRSKMSQFQDVESNLRKQKELEELFKELKAKIALVSRNISTSTNRKDALKLELDKLYEARNTKPPAVEKLEDKVSELRNKKQDLIRKKDEKREEINRIRQEYELFEQQLLEQRALEERKNEIKKIISGITDKKEKLRATADSMDPDNVDILIFSLENAKKKEPFVVNLDVLSSLLKNNVEIPRAACDVDRAVAELEKRRAGRKAEFRARMEEINAELAKLDQAIKSEKEKLARMPPTDHDLLKRGGFRGANRGRA